MFLPRTQSAEEEYHMLPYLSHKPLTSAFLKERHLFKEQIAEGLCKLAVLHQQEVAQRLKVSLHSQLHKEVVHHCLVHQRYTGDGRWRRE